MGLSPASDAQHQHVHPKHNMILLGTDPIFASHIVYKVPHNYQVLLEIKFDAPTIEQYQAAKKNFPNDLFLFLLDPLDIKDIAAQAPLTGKLLRQDSAGDRHEIVSTTTVRKGNFNLIYFDEVPLSLE